MGVVVNGVGSARDEALAALRRVRRGVPVNEAIRAGKPLARADRALMTQLVYGVLRHYRYLDAWIRPWQRGSLEPEVVDILRLAFFQLGFLDRVPAYAVVNAAVNQAKAHNPKVGNLVNAILRRGLEHPPRPETLSLAERYSHPDWIVRRWKERYGLRLENVLSANNSIPPLMLRVDLSRVSRQSVLAQLQAMGVEAVASPYLPEAIRVRGALWLEDIPAFQQGFVAVQDESGMLVTWILDAQAGDEVIDMAIGLGGKAIHTLERTWGRVHLTGVDVAENRLARCRDNLRRAGFLHQVTLIRAQSEHYARDNPQSKDRVILDAPCSNLGVLRRRVDARLHKQEDGLAALVSRQRDLAEAAWRMTKSNGVIVYSACSTEPEETMGIVDGLLTRHDDLVQEDVTPFLPHAALADYVHEKSLRLDPGDLEMDGFFIARLHKQEAP